MKKLIGFHATLPERLKPEYRVKPRTELIVYVQTYLIDKKRIQTEVTYNQSFFKMFWGKTPKNKQKKIVQKLRKSDEKPVDTSNWVKPDTESIKNFLIGNLMLCEILDEKDQEFIQAKTKAETAYAILHSHSPKNPQSLTNFSITPYFLTALMQLADKNGRIKLHEKYFGKFKTQKYKSREQYLAMRAKTLKQMVKIVK